MSPGRGGAGQPNTRRAIRATRSVCRDRFSLSNTTFRVDRTVLSAIPSTAAAWRKGRPRPTVAAMLVHQRQQSLARGAGGGGVKIGIDRGRHRVFETGPPFGGAFAHDFGSRPFPTHRPLAAPECHGAVVLATGTNGWIATQATPPNEGRNSQATVHIGGTCRGGKDRRSEGS